MFNVQYIAFIEYTKFWNIQYSLDKKKFNWRNDDEFQATSVPKVPIQRRYLNRKLPSMFACAQVDDIKCANILSKMEFITQNEVLQLSAYN